VADAVTVVPGTCQLVGEGWSLRAERIEMLNGNNWRALVGVRRGLANVGCGNGAYLAQLSAYGNWRSPTTLLRP